ncbi:hypothetical protein KDM41_16705 [bacterium]|nr:hypothetical protein [bacterium]
MDRYDPLVAPTSRAWFALDEDARIALVRHHHAEAGIDLPAAQLHAVIHVVIENQLLTGVVEVQEAMARLQAEGLDRHDALHAVGQVLVKHIHAVLEGNASSGEPTEAYLADVRGQTRARWLAGRGDTP